MNRDYVTDLDSMKKPKNTPSWMWEILPDPIRLILAREEPIEAHVVQSCTQYIYRSAREDGAIGDVILHAEDGEFDRPQHTDGEVIELADVPLVVINVEHSIVDDGHVSWRDVFVDVVQ